MPSSATPGRRAGTTTTSGSTPGASGTAAQRRPVRGRGPRLVRRAAVAGVLVAGALPFALVGPAGADVLLGAGQSASVSDGAADTVRFTAGVCSADVVVVGAAGGAGRAPAPPASGAAAEGAAGTTLSGRLGVTPGRVLLIGAGTRGADAPPGSGGAGGTVPDGFPGAGEAGARAAGGGGAASSVVDVTPPAGGGTGGDATLPILTAPGGRGGAAPGGAGDGGGAGGGTLRIAGGAEVTASVGAPATGLVLLTANPCTTLAAPPTVTGTPAVGSTLTATPAAFDLAPNSVVLGGWERCTAAAGGGAPTCTPLGGTTERVVTPEDAGSSLRWVNRALSPFQDPVVSASALLSVPAVAPVNTQLPTATGTPEVGATLTGTTGVWTVAGGTLSLTSVWQRCVAGVCTDVPGATAASYVVTEADRGASLRFSVTASNAGVGTTAASAPVGPVPVVLGTMVSRAGYRMVDAAGSTYGFGLAAPFSGVFVSPGDAIVDIEHGPGATGAWTLSRNGVVTPRGDNVCDCGSASAQLLAGESAASLSRTVSGSGYWVFTSRGRALPFGDAVSYGDLRALPLAAPVVDSIVTPSGAGYLMVAADGGVFAFGDARFLGSMGGRHLNRPVVGAEADPDGTGYWLVAADGGVFAFGAEFRGSMGGRPLNQPVVGMVAYGDGYLMVASDGGAFTFSNLPFAGSLAGTPPARPVVAIAAL